MEGQLLGNRYMVIEKIGGGGMAVVYKAKCTLLNRFVALKVLRSEFTNDEEFVKRFRIEAQSAASLSHPNVVSIYDVGNEGSVHYIVMEYIDGVTLKEYIDDKGALKWTEAVNIGAQICSAIEHAHKNHIIHRDIKPHNILITKEGIAKVTDFGIARAVSASTITMVGSTIGSVHYFSPEQARGGFIDEKSDLYSIGITLYEMVTGVVPFNGETPVAVALKHIQDNPQPPVEILESVPTGLNDIIMKAVKKEQSQRYQTASDMLHDLNRVLKDPDGNFVVLNNMNDGAPTRRMNALGEINLEKRSAVKTDEKDGKEKKSNKLTYWLAAITAVVLIIPICIYIGYMVITSFEPGGESKNLVIDNYVNRNIDEVKAELAQKGITNIKEKRITDENIPNDIIIKQNMPAGTTYKKGEYTFLEFTVSKGKEIVKVPDLKNIDYKMARVTLEDKGLKADIKEEFSDTIAKDYVIRTEPEATAEVSAGDTIIIYKSKGIELKPVKVPNLLGLTEAEAKKALADAKLKIGKITPEGVSSSTAKVKSQSPAAGTEVKEEDAVSFEFEEVKNNQTINLTRKINLVDPTAYGDKIKVKIEAIPSDTNEIKIIMDEEKMKADFPLTVNIPVPTQGSTTVKIYFNDKLIKEYAEASPGG